MSDAKLRELERRWRETGAVADEAAYLRERVRVGDLTVERLQLAAWCGHTAAGLASGTSPAPPPRDQDELWSWVEGITLSAPLGMSHPLLSTGQMIRRSSASRLPRAAARELCVVVATHVAEHALRAVGLDEQQFFTEAARDWLAAPSPDRARLAGEREDEAALLAGEWPEESPQASALSCAALAAGAAALGGMDLKAAARVAARAAEISPVAQLHALIASIVVGYALTGTVRVDP